MSQVSDKNVQIVDDKDEVEIDLLELLYFYKSKLLLIIAGFIVGGLLAFAYTLFFVTPLYTAETLVYTVASSTNSVVDLTDLNIGTSLSQDYVELIKIRPVFEETIEELDLDYTPEQLEGMVSVSNISNTRILSIDVTGPDAEEAADIANKIAEISRVKISELMNTPEPNIAETAIVPSQKSSPSYTKNVAIGAVAVAVIILAILTVSFISDDTLNSSEDVEKEFGIIPLTVIPEGDVGALKENDVVDEGKGKKRKKKK